jgi:RNA polymerase subunit RPABC4/transcription elongation factor Spt4
MQEETKVCPNCGTEYYSHIEKCADCSVDLVYKNNTEISSTSFEKTDEFVLIRTDEALFIKDFQRKLTEIGIQSVINVEYTPQHRSSHGHFGTGSYYSIYVSSGNEQKARELEHSQWTKEINQDNLKLDFNVNSENNQNCPACNAFVGIDAKECPSCGLFLTIIE